MENYHPFLALAIKAAVMAGKEIRDVYAHDFNVIDKDDKSPLTEADLRSHKKICEILNETTLPVLSEEGKAIEFKERSHWKLFWMIDPLDGTKEFIKRNGEFTVNIALIQQNEPVMGVIYAPMIDTLYFGCEGIGSFILCRMQISLQKIIPSFFSPSATGGSQIWLQDVVFAKGIHTHIIAPSGTGKTSLIHFLKVWVGVYDNKVS